VKATELEFFLVPVCISRGAFVLSSLRAAFITKAIDLVLHFSSKALI